MALGRHSGISGQSPWLGGHGDLASELGAAHLVNMSFLTYHEAWTSL